MTFDEVVKQLDAMYEGVTRGLTAAGYWIPLPNEPDIVESFRNALARSGGEKVWIVNTGSEDDPIIVALTGNGPRAEANARFLSHLLNNWPVISESIRGGATP